MKELEARGLPLPEDVKKLFEEQKEVKFPVDRRGFFVRKDGKLYEPSGSQESFIRSTARYVLYYGSRGSGKALSIDTPVPTVEGWKPLKDIQVGDYVFSEDGLPTMVVYETDVMYGHPCYRVVFDDGTEIVADKEHLWTVKVQWIKSRLELKTTEELYWSKLMNGNNYNYSIENCSPVQYPETHLPIHPYLLGVWLGDGNKRDAKITIHDGDIQIINRIQSLGYPVHSTSDLYSWSLGNYNGNKKDIQATLRDMGVLGNKHIPDEYLQAPVPQRIELLMGLMDTDGTISQRGHCSFDNTNLDLIYQVRELISSLGIKSGLHKYTSKLDGKEFETYKISFTPSIPVFFLKRKRIRQRLGEVKSSVSRRNIVEVEPVESVPVKCIQVDAPSSLFLVGLSYLPTHNSAAGAQKTLMKIKEGESGAVINPDF